MASDIERLKQEYQQRPLRGDERYSALNIAYLFAIQQRQKATISLLSKLKLASLGDKRLLEIGSGAGDVMQEWLFQRMASENLFGAELLPERLQMAQSRFPAINFANVDAQNLPYPDAQFDIVLQYTVFSSILDRSIKSNIAGEMLRVLKANGFILWYDFWLNPTNPQTKGIRKAEIRDLFPNCDYRFRQITLAPPIARRLVPVSWIAAAILEKLTVLNTHFLVLIQKKP